MFSLFAQAAMKLISAATLLAFVGAPSTATAATGSSSASSAVVRGGTSRHSVSLEKGVDFGILKAPQGCKGVYGGNALLSENFAKKILSKTGFLPASPSTEEGAGVVIQTRLITTTTTLHADRQVEKEGEPVPQGSSVAFVTVNTNDNAYFNHGNERIPIVEGHIIEFDGSVEHNTVVESGSVMLLGPFELPFFDTVGDGGSQCEDLAPEDCCDAFSSGQCALCPVSSSSSSSSHHSWSSSGSNMVKSTIKSSGKKGKEKGAGKKNSSCQLQCVSASPPSGGQKRGRRRELKAPQPTPTLPSSCAVCVDRAPSPSRLLY